MNAIGIEAEKCPQNHACPVINICPAGAVYQETAFSAPSIHDDKCSGCGLCTSFCGYGAIRKS